MERNDELPMLLCCSAFHRCLQDLLTSKLACFLLSLTFAHASNGTRILIFVFTSMLQTNWAIVYYITTSNILHANCGSSCYFGVRSVSEDDENIWCERSWQTCAPVLACTMHSSVELLLRKCRYLCEGAHLQVQRHELMPGGSERPVTQRNKKEFVDLMVDWYLSKSIETLFNAFKAGFYSVASGSSLVLFNHFELELLVCGLPHLDFHAFEKAAVYEGGYTAEHPAVKQFWALLHSLSLEEKKRFLMFVTGSDRAPMGGLGQLRMLIQRASGDTDRLPTSHTCFNVLLLPEYVSEDKMRRMVLTAIDNAQGFGLQ